MQEKLKLSIPKNAWKYTVLKWELYETDLINLPRHVLSRVAKVGSQHI